MSGRAGPAGRPPPSQRPGPGRSRVARLGPRAGRSRSSPLSGAAHGALAGVGQELRAQARGAVPLPAPAVRGGLREVHGESPDSPQPTAWWGLAKGGAGSPATLCPVAASDARSQNSLSTEPLETRHRPCPGSPQPRGEGHDSDRAVWGDRHGDAACERDLEAGRAGTGWPGGSIRRRPRRERPAHRGPGAASAVFGRNRGGPLLLGWVGSSRGLDYAVLE